MAGRRLTAEERAAWARLARSVKPIRRMIPAEGTTAPTPPAPPVQQKTADGRTKTSLTQSYPSAAVTESPRRPAAVLDGSWEKRIRQGSLVPDMAIDLHGHSLESAHGRLDRTLGTALAQSARVVLVITGKPRKSAGNAAGRGRGAIRAEIGHWLETSRHAAAIASVRAAHPRHGGDGALYVILRRKN